MRDNDNTDRPSPAQKLPMVIGPTPRQQGFARVATAPGFLSQLIAERQHMGTQRQKRRSSVGEAVDAYRSGSTITVLRMPQGYRKTVVV